jgi:outer membrane protein TolC
MLDARQAAMFRLALDKGAGEHEAMAALKALRASMLRTGIDAHALLAAMEKAGLAARQVADAEARARRAEAEARVARSKPDPGLTVIKFGMQKDQMIKDVSPFALRRLRAWCEDHACWVDLVRDINDFLDDDRS